MTPVIILGGIYSGKFTPTESAVIAVVYCVIVSVFVYKEFRLVDVYKSLYDSINVNGMTTFMVGFSMAFAAYLTMEKIPARIAAIILGVTDNRILLLLLINLLLLGVGCLIDNIPATIILSPILLPIVTNLGMTPIQFGIMLTMNLAIGFVTPPYGIRPVRGLGYFQGTHEPHDQAHPALYPLSVGGADAGHLCGAGDHGRAAPDGQVN